MKQLLLVTLLACGPIPGTQPTSQAQPAQDPPSGQRPVMPPPSNNASPGAEPNLPAPNGDWMAAQAAIAKRFVDEHNLLRAKHCAPPLTWSSTLATVAQNWANSLKAQGCKFGHSGGQYGENLAAGSEGALDPEAVVRMWYDEISKYRFPDGGFSMDTGHFTQVVWKGTTQVGCGHTLCNGMDIFVCNYDPAGNVEGEYRNNVLPLGCH